MSKKSIVCQQNVFDIEHTRNLSEPERNENSETLLYVKLKVLKPTDTKIAVTFNCDVEKSSLGRGGLYEVVQYFQNKLKPR